MRRADPRAELIGEPAILRGPRWIIKPPLGIYQSLTT
jgi:hypothetical protein